VTSLKTLAAGGFVVLLLFCAAVPIAYAGTATYSATTGLRFDAAPGEANSVVITLNATPNQMDILDQAGTLAVTAGAGCAPAPHNSRIARCVLTGNRVTTITLGDLDDRFTPAGGGQMPDLFVFGGDGVDTISGGTGFDRLVGDGGDDAINASLGNDQVEGGPGNDRLAGGINADTLLGQDGNDVLFSDQGNDSFDGGAGTDTVDYSGELGPRSVQVSIDDVANDVVVENGTPRDAGDNVRTSVENVVGTGGGDTIVGSDQPNRLDGAGGDDRLRGDASAAASARPLPRSITVRIVFFDDRLFGGPGADFLAGGPGGDLLDGGTGGDRLKGEAGNDSLRAVDGEADAPLSCGDDGDELDEDLRDPQSPADCETVTFGEVREGRHVVLPRRSLRAAADGTVPVRLACPRGSGVRSCAGTLRLRLLGGARATAAATAAFSVPTGSAATLRVPLTAAERATLRRFGVAVARLTAREPRGRNGRARVTVVTLLLRNAPGS
jgi:Ca2+-binding RTX toxin-like protein